MAGIQSKVFWFMSMCTKSVANAQSTRSYEWVSSFLTAHQHTEGHYVPLNGMKIKNRKVSNNNKKKKLKKNYKNQSRSANNKKAVLSQGIRAMPL